MQYTYSICGNLTPAGNIAVSESKPFPIHQIISFAQSEPIHAKNIYNLLIFLITYNL